jgi:hypothetical protein
VTGLGVSLGDAGADCSAGEPGTRQKLGRGEATTPTDIVVVSTPHYDRTPHVSA